MSDFRRLSESVLASPQIEPTDVAHAKALGVTLIVNNRPDGESPDQAPGESIAAAARAAGLDYVAIPVGGAGFGHAQVAAMGEAIERAGEGKVLAYCRSGTRSTLLWALAQSAAGTDPETTAAAAAAAGYDVAPVRAAMDLLAAGH